MSSGFERQRGILLASLVLLAAFLIASYHLGRESLWYDEGWTLWAVRDEATSPDSLASAARFVRDSLRDTLARVRGDVHPPLYFVILDVWTMLAGESVYAVRLLSALTALLALAATYAVGTALFDRRAGLMAAVLLGTASFFVYYAREARMYMLLVALSALSVWAYLLWLRRPTKRRAGLYALALALLMYTHYSGALVIAAQVIHLAVRFRGIRAQHAAPLLAAGVLYLPWIPVLVEQIRVNNARPLAQPLPPELGTVVPLLLILTSGYWWMYLLPFVLGRALPEARRNRSAIGLLAAWVLVTPLALVALNMWLGPVFQIRYNIAVLPAGALLVAYGLRQVGGRGNHQDTRNTKISLRLPVWTRGLSPLFVLWGWPLAVFLLLWLAYTQLAMYTEFWPDKPRWREAVAQMVAARQPLEPAITDINPQNVAAYYDRLYGIRRGISVDLSWREHTPEEMREIVRKLEASPSVWAVMRTDMPSTWAALASLDGVRGVGYRDSVMNVIFYRFDAAKDDHLRFRFGDLLRYESGIGHQLYARAGETFCLPVELTLTALGPLDGSYSAGVSLTQGYNTLRARWDTTLGTRESGEQFKLAPCLDVPDDEPPGSHDLRLVVYQGHDLNRAPVIEGPPESNLYWGAELMLATVSVDR